MSGNVTPLASSGRGLVHTIFRVGDLVITLLKSGAETQGRFCLFELIIPPHHDGILPHLHRDCDQMLVGAAGVTLWTIGTQQVPLRSGQRVFIPRGILHSCVNQGHETARIACMYSPASVAPGFFHELALAAAGGADTLSRLSAVLARAGMLPGD